MADLPHVPERPFGRGGSPVSLVSLVGEGTWQMESDDRRAAVRAIRAGLDLGIRHVDTAEMYGQGAVEEIVGEAIEGRRDEVFLVSKVLPSNATFEGTQRSCEASLRRLRTDRLDVHLLHWPGGHPLEETIRAFERLVEQGKTLRWGLSNFAADELDEALVIAGEGRIACNQVLYHLRERRIEHDVIPWCERHGVAVVAYSPFGSGRFPSLRSGGGRVLKEIADARGATPHQVALAFLARRPSVFTIPKASDEAHVRDNAAAGALELSAEEIRRIDDAFPPGRRRRGVPTL